MDKIGAPICRKRYKLTIWIGCPPGEPRPGDVANWIGMKWKHGETVTSDEFTRTAAVFGDWAFEKLYCDEDEAKREGKELFEKLKEYYPHTIRYGAYEVEEEEE